MERSKLLLFFHHLASRSWRQQPVSLLNGNLLGRGLATFVSVTKSPQQAACLVYCNGNRLRPFNISNSSCYTTSASAVVEEGLQENAVSEAARMTVSAAQLMPFSLLEAWPFFIQEMNARGLCGTLDFDSSVPPTHDQLQSFRDSLVEFSRVRADILFALSKADLTVLALKDTCPHVDVSRKLGHAMGRLARDYAGKVKVRTSINPEYEAFLERGRRVIPRSEFPTSFQDVIKVVTSWCSSWNELEQQEPEFKDAIRSILCTILNASEQPADSRRMLKARALSTPTREELTEAQQRREQRELEKKKAFEKIHSERIARVVEKQGTIRARDWFCGSCETLNYKKNIECYNCGTTAGVDNCTVVTRDDLEALYGERYVDRRLPKQKDPRAPPPKPTLYVPTNDPWKTRPDKGPVLLRPGPQEGGTGNDEDDPYAPTMSYKVGGAKGVTKRDSSPTPLTDLVASTRALAQRGAHPSALPVSGAGTGGPARRDSYPSPLSDTVASTKPRGPSTAPVGAGQRGAAERPPTLFQQGERAGVRKRQTTLDVDVKGFVRQGRKQEETGYDDLDLEILGLAPRKTPGPETVWSTGPTVEPQGDGVTYKEPEQDYGLRPGTKKGKKVRPKSGRDPRLSVTGGDESDDDDDGDYKDEIVRGDARFTRQGLASSRAMYEAETSSTVVYAADKDQRFTQTASPKRDEFSQAGRRRSSTGYSDRDNEEDFYRRETVRRPGVDE